MFMEMIGRIKEETLEYLFKIKTVSEEKKEERVFNPLQQNLVHEEKSQFEGVHAGTPEEAASYGGQLPESFGKSSGFRPEQGRRTEEKVSTYHREEPKVGRNDPCPCGSGKKYKKCCGK